MDHIFSCTCNYLSGHSRHWKGTWSETGASRDFCELHISARGSLFTVIFGSSSSGNWACIPELGIGAPLSCLSDVFWNFEKLSRLASRPDAATIAYALADYEKHHNM